MKILKVEEIQINTNSSTCFLHSDVSRHKMTLCVQTLEQLLASMVWLQDYCVEPNGYGSGAVSLETHKYSECIVLVSHEILSECFAFQGMGERFNQECQNKYTTWRNTVCEFECCKDAVKTYCICLYFLYNSM